MIVVIAGTKGGVAKTTTAVCLALEAASRGRDVLIVDLDPQGTAREWQPELTKHLPHAQTAAEITDAGNGHDLVILDTPPGGAPQSLAAIEAADLVVAVTGLGPGDMRGLQHLMRLVDPDLIVPTRRDGRRAIHAHGLDALTSRFPSLVTVPVPMSAAVERAQADQTGLGWVSSPAIAYRAVYERLVALEQA